ncbi:MAG: signal peptidase II [Candidatus Abawacabacteria bacterium]|nr:signal peptidase II [Candidatus Abawacabacteria bacterium]
MKIVILSTLAIILGDQISKQLVLHYQLPYSMNSGIAFSLPLNNTLALITSIVVIMGFGIFFCQQKTKSNLNNIAFGMIIGGAIGNIIDRLLHGAVIDFIKIPYWPTFNVADAAITIGVILLIGGQSRKSKI